MTVSPSSARLLNLYASSLYAHALAHSTPALVATCLWLRRPLQRLLARLSGSCSECTLIPISSYLSVGVMAVAINTARLALDFIPRAQVVLDRETGGRRRLQIHRISVYATIPFPDSELWRQSRSAFHGKGNFDVSLSNRDVLNWQADPEDHLGDAAVLHHLHQQAAAVPLLSSVLSHSDHGNSVTTLTGSALSASVNAEAQEKYRSSFHCYSFRNSCISRGSSTPPGLIALGQGTCKTSLFPSSDRKPIGYDYFVFNLNDFIVWACPPREDHIVLWQVQVDLVDLFSRRTLYTSRPGKRRRTAFNEFLQVSDSPVVEDTSRRSPFPHARRFNGVRHRPDREIWVAEMKPPKHKTKQDFGNFKTEVEAARAVDAAFHHYGKPHLLNFPDTSLQFLSTRPTAPPGLDEKAKVKFVKEEAKLLLANNSPLHSTPTNSLQMLELSASPRRCPSGQFLSLSEISLLLSCCDPDEDDTAASQWVDLDSICDISTTGVQSDLETLNSVQNAEQGLDWAEDSSTLAAPRNAVNLSAYKNQSTWLDSLIRSPPALTSSRSPSPSHFQEGIAYGLLEQQCI